MTILYYIFVIYNSVNKINIVCVFMFTIYVVIIFSIYKSRIRELIRLGIEYLKDIFTNPQSTKNNNIEWSKSYVYKIRWKSCESV